MKKIINSFLMIFPAVIVGFIVLSITNSYVFWLLSIIATEISIGILVKILRTIKLRNNKRNKK